MYISHAKPRSLQISGYCATRAVTQTRMFGWINVISQYTDVVRDECWPHEPDMSTYITGFSATRINQGSVI